MQTAVTAGPDVVTPATGSKRAVNAALPAACTVPRVFAPRKAATFALWQVAQATARPPPCRLSPWQLLQSYAPVPFRNAVYSAPWIAPVEKFGCAPSPTCVGATGP